MNIDGVLVGSRLYLASGLGDDVLESGLGLLNAFLLAVGLKELLLLLLVDRSDILSPLLDELVHDAVHLLRVDLELLCELLVARVAL